VGKWQVGKWQVGKWQVGRWASGQVAGGQVERIVLSYVRFPDDQALTWQDLEMIRASERGCFVVEENAPRKIQVFSEATNRLYSLMPTAGAPTMLISGIPMHRFKGTDPHRDTLQKIRTITPVVGRVLDTATGLAYTAIEAAKTAEHVITVEIEPAVLEVARLNPWSQALFENPRIAQLIGDTVEEIEGFEGGTFARIIHDSLLRHILSPAFPGSAARRSYVSLHWRSGEQVGPSCCQGGDAPAAGGRLLAGRAPA